MTSLLLVSLHLLSNKVKMWRRNVKLCIFVHHVLLITWRSTMVYAMDSKFSMKQSLP